MLNFSRRVSFVVISWNEIERLQRCLDSLYENIDLEKDEVVLVDNASQDSTNETILQKYQWVRYLRLSENIGVGPARNRAISLAQGKYIMTLDADAWLISSDPGSHIELEYNENKLLGGLAGTILNPDDTVQSSIRRYPKFYQPIAARVPFLKNLSFMKKEQKRHLMLDVNQETEQDNIHVDYMLGANQIFKKEVWAYLGGYDEKIFYGPEDCEFMYRVAQIGLSNKRINRIIVKHEYQRRTRRFNRLLLKHLTGFVYMFRKHGNIVK